MNIEVNITPEKPPQPVVSQRPSSLVHKEDVVEPETSSAFRGGPNKRSGLKLVSWMLASVMVDVLILIGLSCLFLIVISQVFKQSFIHPTFEMGLSIYTLISWIYFVVFRVFIGATVGEWSCDLRVGQPYERLQAQYPLRIVARVTLITFSGVIIIPLLSLLFKKDLAGHLTRAKLYSLQ